MIASVCYITCGIHDLQQRTLKALLKHTPQEHEIIILQNNTVIETPILRDVTMLHTDELVGIPRARNLCLDAVTGEVVIWIDDDIEVTSGYVDAFLEPYQDKQVGLTGYDTLIIQDNFWNQWYVDPAETEGEFDYFDSPYSIRTSMVNEIGPHDENLGLIRCSNTDMCMRAYASGWKLHWIPNPGCKHWRSYTIDGFLRRGKWSLAKKYNETKKSHEWMWEKHGRDWRQRYGMQRKPFEVDTRLQFPYITGRLGGPEDKQWQPSEWFGMEN